jgi:hypothetical protein
LYNNYIQLHFTPTNKIAQYNLTIISSSLSQPILKPNLEAGGAVVLLEAPSCCSWTMRYADSFNS